MKIQTFVSIVIYVNNGASTIKDCLLLINTYMEKYFKQFEIIVVNDASHDHTVNEVKNAADLIFNPVTLINLAWFQGNELGMKAGTDMTIGDFVYEIEYSSVDYNFDLLLKLYEKAITGYDIVSASPDKRTKISSILFYKIINKISYLSLDITTETIRVISRRALNVVQKANEKVRYRKILYNYSGFESTLIKYKTIKSNNKGNKQSLISRVGLAFDIILNYSNFGFHFASMLSILFLGISFFMMIYTIIIYLFQDRVVSGWTTTMLFLSIGFSGIFMILTIVSRYMSFILLEIRNRPLYVIRSIERINNE